MVIARTVDSARLRVGCLRLILINRGTLLPCARTFHILERSVSPLRARVTVQQLSTFRLVVIARLDDSKNSTPFFDSLHPTPPPPRPINSRQLLDSARKDDRTRDRRESTLGKYGEGVQRGTKETARIRQRRRPRWD